MTEQRFGQFSMLDAGNQTPADIEYVEGLSRFAASSPGDTIDIFATSRSSCRARPLPSCWRRTTYFDAW